jgi:hypothetical protein
MRISGLWQAAFRTCAIAVLATCALADTTTCAQAASVTAAPGWEVNPMAYPSALPPGGKGYLVLAVYNVGKAGSSGTVTVTDKLPAGVTATEAGYNSEPFVNSELEGGLGSGKQWDCSVGSVVTCTNNASHLQSIPPGETELLAIAVNVSAGASGSATNEVTVAGGGAQNPANVTTTIDFGGLSAPVFGFQRADGWFSNADGTLDTQAGSHPYSLTVSLSLNNTGLLPAGEPRAIDVELPRGLIGNPTAMPRCTSAQLTADQCPVDSQVGVDRVALGGVFAFYFGEGEERPTIEEFGQDFLIAAQLPVYNMVPPPGVPAQLAFSLVGLGTRINTKVRSGGDYGITAAVNNIIQTQITFDTITVWGVPGDSSHDFQREGRSGDKEGVKIGGSSQIAEQPFLTLPTACEGPQTFTASTEPWPAGGVQGPLSEASFLSHENSGAPVGITGCDHLGFNPSVSVAPDTTQAETPTGLTVEVKTPQEGLTAVEGLAVSNIKDTTVTLPEGVAINPGQAHGLLTCSAAQSAIGTEGEPSCPNASKVGTDEIETPLLFHGLKGNVYVLDSNPPNLKLLVAASGEGVNLKLLGDVHLDESTGRLTTTFKETPELPFTNFRLSFSGGAQAALYTPAKCGAYKTVSDFTPWSTPSVANAFPSSEFLIDSGPNGSSCAPQSFAPTLTAGATTDQAGGYTGFSLLLSRPDGQQRIEKLQFKTPEGLLGMISHVTPCQEPQAAAGTCPATSQIGHTTVEAGPGSAPLVIPEPGQAPAPIYLTGPYKGAPFGLSIAVPVIAGPFNLGTVVVRGSIAVDPNTTQLTITTDPLPSILDGVPTDLRVINAVIDHPAFMINPTNCTSSSFSGIATSLEETTAPISSRFGVGSCRSLTFKPTFSVTTQAHASRGNGSSLTFKIGYPKDAMGSQSWFNEAKFDIPKQLPARLSTIQQACLASTFEHERSKCPKHSIIGHALVHTPVLPTPLEGPVYFVSYGGAKFPDAVVVLDGDNVHVELHGNTFINGKTGVTSATFKALPDVPFESIEVSLPTGEYSEFGANLPAKAKDSFCGQKLTMPTYFKAQNGLEIKQNTKLAVTGCPKAKKASKRNAKKANNGKKAKGRS